MNNLLIELLRILVIFIFIFILFYFLRLSISIKREKRVTRFSAKSLNEKQQSLSEKIKNTYITIINSISNILNKLHLSQYIKNHNKTYISNDKVKYPELFMASSKIFTSILSLIIVFILALIKYKTINITTAIIILLIGYFIPNILTYTSKTKQKKEMEQDLLKAVIIMNNAFKSGRSIMQAIELVSQELEGNMAKEFKKMFIDLTYGLELEIVFLRFYQRVKLEEVKYISSSLILANKTGGNISSIFSSIEKEFYERKKLKDELFSQTALSNLVFKILIVIPILVFLSIFIINPTYYDPMINTSIGKILTLIIITIYIIYIIIVRKIVKEEVW